MARAVDIIAGQGVENAASIVRACKRLGLEIAAASALRTLTSAVDAHLVATVNITDSVARRMAALTAGRRDGQALTIILGSATASLTVQHGASANTRLNGGIDKVLSGGNARCDLVWSQGAWRELA